jgi:two-component system, cell cycle sensor histidine kinase and response regulator CckA
VKTKADDLYGNTIRLGMQRIQRREWWLWSSAAVITFLLTLGLLSFTIAWLRSTSLEIGGIDVSPTPRGLVGLVFLFYVYVVYQQLQIYRMRRRLLQREEVFRLITENAADMIAVVDEQGQRVYNSPSYERILGYKAVELQSTEVSEQIHPDDLPLVAEAAAHARNTGVGRQMEYRMRDKEGNWHALESTASAIFDSHGTYRGLVIVNRDITDRKRLGEQFRQSQKMEAIGRLSGGIAHDFNNLLGIIIGYAEILQESMREGNADRECVDEILRSGQRAAALTRQLLAFSRQQVLEPKIIQLNAVVADMERLLRRVIGEDIELNTSAASDLNRVKADQGQLEQVLLNLAVNARDAMPSGGRLSITTRNVTLSRLDVHRYSYPVKPGEYVKLTVSDTGIGMDSATVTRIFEPFFTTKEKGKGTGLGLSTVYGVVKQSDGYIDTESVLGKGTIFTIYLPAVMEAVTTLKSPNALVTTSRGNECVLLVEDEDALRFLTRNMLQRFGYKVLEAGNAAEARQISDEHKDSIDLLLTDIVMPGMNGRELANYLMDRRPRLKVLYMSGHTGQGIGQAILPTGSHFLPKPFSREHLAAKIREALQVELPAAVLEGTRLQTVEEESR